MIQKIELEMNGVNNHFVSEFSLNQLKIKKWRLGNNLSKLFKSKDIVFIDQVKKHVINFGKSREYSCFIKKN